MGVFLSVKVVPQSASSRVGKMEGGALKIYVHAAAQKGEANDELVAFLAKLLHLPKSAISVRLGRSARSKLLFIEGIEKEKMCTLLGVEIS